MNTVQCGEIDAPMRVIFAKRTVEPPYACKSSCWYEGYAKLEVEIQRRERNYPDGELQIQQGLRMLRSRHNTDLGKS